MRGDDNQKLCDSPAKIVREARSKRSTSDRETDDDRDLRIVLCFGEIRV